jgi:pyruvate,orthophosphate dikinase
MLHGVVTASSVDPVTGEETASGELLEAGARRGIPIRALRGDSLGSRHPAVADRIAAQLRELDAKHGGPVTVIFDVHSDQATARESRLADLSPAALVRVLVTRVGDGRLTRADAIARLPVDALAANGVATLAVAAPSPVARGLAASPGVASGRLAVPDDFATPSADPRIVILDDAAPEDAMAIRAAVAVIATSGGLTADAAIAARALRKPCVVSATVRLGDRDQPARGDWVTVDGSGGGVYIGALPTRWTPTPGPAAQIVEWLALQPDETLDAALERAKRRGSQAPSG